MISEKYTVKNTTRGFSSRRQFLLIQTIECPDHFVMFVMTVSHEYASAGTLHFPMQPQQQVMGCLLAPSPSFYLEDPYKAAKCLDIEKAHISYRKADHRWCHITLTQHL